MVTERLQKILSNAGVASRRHAEALILEGRISVNGSVTRVLGARADPEIDEITLDGIPVIKSRYRYLMMNKPPGVITSTHDPQNRRTVLSLLSREAAKGLHPVGRLDLDSSGLLILTNDGRLTDLLTHPRNQVEKEYLVGIHTPLASRAQQQMVRGVHIDGETLRAASVSTVEPPEFTSIAAGAWVLVTLRQGRKREIRRMLSSFGKRVISLQRVRVGPLHLGDLRIGKTRELTPEEVDLLYEVATAAQREEAEAPAAVTAAVAPPAFPGMATPERPASTPAFAPAPSAAPRTGPASPVAIDGSAGSGKSTLAAGLAERLDYGLLDTGLLYRVVTFACQRAGIPATDELACAATARDAPFTIQASASTRIMLAGEDVTALLRSPEVEAAVSDYSKIPGVRAALLARQRMFASRPRTILVGRDIGTVVLPDAPVKLYLEASPEARAERRSAQATEWGTTQDAASAAHDITTRDTIDSTRVASPMRPAPGAIVIDTTTLTPAEVLARAVEAVTCAVS